MAAASPTSAPFEGGKVGVYADELTNPAFQRLTWVRLGPDGGLFSLKFNPVVSLLSAAIIWAMVIWSALDPDKVNEELSEWRSWVAEEWSWLYIASQNIWICVLAYIVIVSKYANIKLGKDDDKPEFSLASWFAMLFSCGVATGLWYYCTAEPMWHYNGWGGSRFAALDDNTRATHSLMVTWFHWGIHGWIPYTVVGALLGITAYRRDLPMTIRFCFYPLIGDMVYGWLGDLIDVLSIVCTMFGVCTSLGLGVMQINKGLVRLDWDMYRGVAGNDGGMAGIEQDTDTQIVIIWCITALATVSVVSGLQNGIRRISEVCFVIGLFMMFNVLFMGDSMYILNLITQTFGYYLWYLPKISWHTDAYELLGVYSGDGLGGAGWMDSWTIFYWGWWISWAPFCGLFMAKISRGRTLREFILGTLFIPSLYSFFFMGIFGAESLGMERRAEAAGLDCGDWSMSAENLHTVYSTENKDVRLWCLGTEDILFEVLASYGDKAFGALLSVFALICLVLYFITSSDSGSLVIDILAANGVQDPPMLQRVFWALSEGAAACALLYAGGNDALRALQTASIVAGLPYTFVLFWMTQALYIVVKEESKEISPDRPSLKSFFFQLDHSGSGNIPTGLAHTGLNLVAPFVSFGRIMNEVWGNGPLYAASSGILFILAIVLLGLQVVEYNFMMMGASVYMLFTMLLAIGRMAVREHIGCETGDPLTDWLVCMCFYPLALSQMEAELAQAGSKGTKVIASMSM
jgi:choline/carnitine/betaine transport